MDWQLEDLRGERDFIENLLVELTADIDAMQAYRDKVETDWLTIFKTKAYRRKRA